jgi:Na+/H+-dicarboxylate symporter
MMCDMSATGKLATVMGAGVKVIATGVALSICYLFLQFIIAGIISRKNPLRCIKNILPAYLTGFSICSSSAVIPVTLDCTLKNGVSKEIAGFVIPLCGTVHMCGSVIKLMTTTIAITIMCNIPISPALIVNFVLLQAVAAVAAPGVMGGVLMASVGLLESILGFSPEQTALVMTIYLALDGYGPACNVSGDSAIALIIDRFFGKKVKAETEISTNNQ